MAIVRKPGGSGGGPAKILIADRVPNPRDLTSVWQPGDGFYPLNDQTFRISQIRIFHTQTLEDGSVAEHIQSTNGKHVYLFF